MKTNKKLVISFSIIIGVLIGVVVSLAAVLASFQGSSEGGFEISYSAKNVNAKVTAAYKQVDSTTYDSATNPGAYTTIKSAADGDYIEFNSSDTNASVTKNFKKVESIAMSKNDYIFINYTIQNTDASANPTSFKVGVNTNFTTSENLKIEYAATENATSWSNNITDVINETTVTTAAPLNLFVRISIDTKTQPASFNGSFNFTLSVIE